jgi:uncharacterized protein (TIGR02594 family)
VTDSLSTLQIQKALIALGYDLGPDGADGVPDRITQAAISSFQKLNGLPGSGLVGPRTIAALMARGVLNLPGMGALVLPWLDEAKRWVGLTETPGPANNPTLMGWADDFDLAYTADSIPWCGLFMAHVIGATLPAEQLPKTPLWAKAWASWGVPLPKPALGCVAVLERPGGGGHVCLYTGESGETFRGLGGNQSDKVGYAWFARARVIAWRWPKTAHVPELRPVLLARNGAATSTNEA